MKCGKCLMEHVDIVELNVDGSCPCCAVNHKMITPEDETFERQPLPRRIKGQPIKVKK